MRVQHLLISLIGLCLCFGMIFLGIFLFLTLYISNFSAAVHALVDHHMEEIAYMGLAIFFLGALLCVVMMGLNKRRYLLLKMGGVFVQDSLIAHFAKESLNALFAGGGVECDVVVTRKKKIEIFANVPFVSENRRKKTFSEMERVLVETLLKQCQYDKDFILNVSFSPE